MEKIGVFGGTFNPIHLAHVHTAQQYAKKLRLDKVILVPASIPPHKIVKDLASANDRLTMCQLAVERLPLFEVSAYEVTQGGKSYTFKTLRHIKAIYPNSELYLIVGADMFVTVHDWRQPKEIFKLATICAAQRDIGEFTLLQAHKMILQNMGAKCEVLELQPFPMSSTQIREKLRNGEDVSAYLHPHVLEYIEYKNLYSILQQSKGQRKD